MSDDSTQYSAFGPMQKLGEEIAVRGVDGPTRQPRLKFAIVGLLAAGVIAVTPAGAAVGDAIDDLIGSEPTASSLYLGDLPEGHTPSKAQEAYFDAVARLSQVVGEGTTPLGTPFQMVVREEASSPVFGSSAFIAFDTDQTSSRSVDTGIGPTVSEGFKHDAVPLYPTAYRGPIEEGETPTPVIIGVAPADATSIEVTYLDSDDQRVSAPTTTAPVTSSILAAKDDEIGADEMLEPPVRPDARPSFSNDPYAFFVAFLPPDLDRAGAQARQVDLDFNEIEVTAFDANGQELYSMRMNGRYSGDPGIASVG